MLDGLKAGAPGAWQRLVKLYGPLVYDWCRQRRLQQADAEDVVQEVFRAVWERVGGFRHEAGGTFRGWLWTITWNRLGDHFRRRGARPAAVGGSDAARRLHEIPAPPCDDSSPEISALLQRALETIRAEFRDATWQAFWRVVVEDRSPVIVAEEVGLSVNAVYLAKSRILRRLREELGDEQG